MKKTGDLSDSVMGVSTPSIEAADFQAPNANSIDAGILGSEAESYGPSASDSYLSQKTQATKRWWHSQFNLMLAVFGLLAVSAALFVLLAPPPEVIQPEYASIVNETLIPDSETPWTQSQQAEARSESQAILSSMLESKKTLEQKEVLIWAPERFQQALDLADQGDQLYKEANFAGAVQAYQNAADQMDSLYDLLPAIIDARLSEGDEAIKQGKSELAKQNFEQALELDEGNLRATEGLGRAQKLDQVLQLLSQSSEKEKEFLVTGDLEALNAAQSSLQKASQIDPKFLAVAEGIARIDSAITEKRFQLAMSEAYQALFSNKFGSARKAFSSALKIKPGDPTASAALQQSLASDKNASLSSLLRGAKEFETQEQWGSAKSNYETVLQRDANQVSAKLGRIRTGARSQLNTQIEKVLSDTLSFSQTEQKDRASRVLADAQSIKQKGPKLLKQIAQLEAALVDSNASIKISFVSDALTQVSLQKVGSKVLNLGKFSNRKMALKPGRYIATGVRLGFQDVRKEIEIYPGSDAMKSIEVQCKEAITVSSVGARSNG